MPAAISGRHHHLPRCAAQFLVTLPKIAAAASLWDSYAAPACAASLSYADAAILRPEHARKLEAVMPDFAFVVLGLVWFALSLGYAAGCERL